MIFAVSDFCDPDPPDSTKDIKCITSLVSLVDVLAVEAEYSYEVENVIELAEKEGVSVMPIAGLKSSKWDPCRNKAQYVEQCLGQNDFKPEECQPQLADLKRCCERYQVMRAYYELLCGRDTAYEGHLQLNQAFQSKDKCTALQWVPVLIRAIL